MKLKEMLLNGRTRFPPSLHKCPQCKLQALADNWPPNYGSGNMYVDAGKGSRSSSGGRQKCVCKACKIAFAVVSSKEMVYHVNGAVDVLKDEHEVCDVVPLVERDGCWLTPHDVWREDYRVEHGQYPREAYI